MMEKIRHIKTRANAYLDQYALEYRVLVKVDKLERHVEKLQNHIDKMMDSDEEIMDQHKKLFKILEKGDTPSTGYNY